MLTPSRHTAVSLGYLRGQASEVVLFYSGGKDSVVLLDILSQHFKKVYCVFMFFVPGLKHIQPYLAWLGNYKNVELIQLPHWMTSYYIKHGYYSFHRPGKEVKAFKQADVEKTAREQTGCKWLVFGHKQADSMDRRVMLRQYLFNAINIKQQKVYPLSTWSKQNVKDYISIKQLIKPIEYSNRNSNGLDLTLDCFIWLRNNCPEDLEKIYSVFPLSKQILFEYDYEQQQRTSLSATV